jgi:lactoylglutathione lyase
MTEANTHQNLQKAVPFFMVIDMKASLNFYVDGLGFEIKIDWRPNGEIEWCWLEREGVALMLQEYRPQYLPQESLGIGMSVCFMCNDALALYKEFLQRGLVPDEPYVGNRLWVVELKDPDGYRIAFESPTTVAEETKYNEYLKIITT